jgi:hypothetical protein
LLKSNNALHVNVMDNTKDIVVAIMGASVALSGLLLIFCGFLFAQAATFPKATTADTVINRYRHVGQIGGLPFLASLALAGVSLWWLMCPSPLLFNLCWVGFIVLLVGTGLYGILAILKYM